MVKSLENQKDVINVIKNIKNADSSQLKSIATVIDQITKNLVESTSTNNDNKASFKFIHYIFYISKDQYRHLHRRNNQRQKHHGPLNSSLSSLKR